MQAPYDILACAPKLHGLIMEVLNKGK